MFEQNKEGCIEFRIGKEIFKEIYLVQVVSVFYFFIKKCFGFKVYFYVIVQGQKDCIYVIIFFDSDIIRNYQSQDMNLGYFFQLLYVDYLLCV